MKHTFKLNPAQKEDIVKYFDFLYTVGISKDKPKETLDKILSMKKQFIETGLFETNNDELAELLLAKFTDLQVVSE